jgi:hypothetical protein
MSVPNESFAFLATLEGYKRLEFRFCRRLFDSDTRIEAQLKARARPHARRVVRAPGASPLHVSAL